MNAAASLWDLGESGVEPGASPVTESLVSV
jgi:hypothetical protein